MSRKVRYTECHHAKGSYADRHFAKRRCAKCRCAECSCAFLNYFNFVITLEVYLENFLGQIFDHS